jgi:hypothetical protein
MPNFNRSVSSDPENARRKYCRCAFEDPVREMRSVLKSSNCCGARRPASVFAFGVTALYVRKERCQYKCRNVLAFLDNRRFAAVAHFQTLQISLRGPGFQKTSKKLA